MNQVWRFRRRHKAYGTSLKMDVAWYFNKIWDNYHIFKMLKKNNKVCQCWVSPAKPCDIPKQPSPGAQRTARLALESNQILTPQASPSCLMKGIFFPPKPHLYHLSSFYLVFSETNFKLLFMTLWVPSHFYPITPAKRKLDRKTHLSLSF